MRTQCVWFALGVAVCSSSAARVPRFAVAAQTSPREVVDTISFETSEGTRLSFDVSPDGRFIVIDLLGQLWRVPTGGR